MPPYGQSIPTPDEATRKLAHASRYAADMTEYDDALRAAWAAVHENTPEGWYVGPQWVYGRPSMARSSSDRARSDRNRACRSVASPPR